MRISDWSSDVCSSDLRSEAARLCLRIKEGIDRRERPRQMIDDGDSEQLFAVAKTPVAHIQPRAFEEGVERFAILWIHAAAGVACLQVSAIKRVMLVAELAFDRDLQIGIAVETRSEEHTSELQSLMRISYAVFCLKKKTT